MNLGQLTAYLGADITDFQRKMAQVESRMQSVGQKMQSAGKKMTLMLSLPLAAAGAASFKAASDLQENINKIDAVFKESAKTVHQWSESSIKSMGLAQSSALDAASLFGDMATSMGMTSEDASKMSMSLVQLAADLASFKNIGIDQAKTALAGIFTGETESLKRLGIVMTENALQQWTLSKGMEEYSSKMSESTKIQLRYAYVMDMTSNAQGDFMRTQGGAANQMRMFRESIKETAASFGNVLLPILTPVINKLNDFLKRLNNMSAGGQRTTIIVAGLAAAAGPLLIVLGKVAVGIGVIRKAMVALYAAILKNPITAIIAGLVALGIAIYTAVTRTTELEKSQDRLNKAQSEAIEPLKREQVEIQSLIRQVMRANAGTTQRQKAIEELNKRYPELLRNYDQEKITNTELLTVLNDVNKSFRERMKLKAAEALQQQAIDEATAAEMKLIKLREEQNILTSDRKISPKKGNRLREIYNEITILTAVAANANREFDKTQKLIDKMASGTVQPTTETKQSPGGLIDKDALKEQQEAARQAADDYKQLIGELSELQMTEWDKALMSLQKNYDDRYAIIENYAKKHNKSDEWLMQQKQILDATYDVELDVLTKERLKKEQEQSQKIIDETKRLEDEKYNIRKQAGIVSAEEELARRLDELKIYYDQEKISLEEWSDARAALIKQFNEYQGAENYKALIAWYDLEIAKTQKLYDEKVIDYTEYIERIKGIDKNYAQFKKNLDKELAYQTAAVLGDLFGKISGMYKEGSKQAKAFAYLQIIVDSAAAAVKAYKAFADYGAAGVILGAAAAAAALAYGWEQANRVQSVQYQGGATGGVITQGGMLRVGEQGEELVNLPAGASITPHKNVDIPNKQLIALMQIYAVMQSIKSKINIQQPDITVMPSANVVTATTRYNPDAFYSRNNDMVLTTKVSGRDLEIVLNRTTAQTKRR